MSDIRPIEEAQVQQWLEENPDWTVVDGALQAEFAFPSFIEAFGFMARVALHAEKMNHHPDWTNVYNRVSVSLSTHDVGQISNLDLRLARIMSELSR